MAKRSGLSYNAGSRQLIFSRSRRGAARVAGRRRRGCRFVTLLQPSLRPVRPQREQRTKAKLAPKRLPLVPWLPPKQRRCSTRSLKVLADSESHELGEEARPLATFLGKGRKLRSSSKPWKLSWPPTSCPCQRGPSEWRPLGLTCAVTFLSTQAREADACSSGASAPPSPLGFCPNSGSEYIISAP